MASSILSHITSSDGMIGPIKTVALPNGVRAVYGGNIWPWPRCRVSSPYYQTSLTLIFTIPPTNLLGLGRTSRMRRHRIPDILATCEHHVQQPYLWVATSSSFGRYTNGRWLYRLSNTPSSAAWIHWHRFIGVGSGGKFIVGDGQSWVDSGNSATLNNLRRRHNWSGLMDRRGRTTGAIKLSPTAQSGPADSGNSIRSLSWRGLCKRAVWYRGYLAGADSPDGFLDGQIPATDQSFVGDLRLAGFAAAGPEGTFSFAGRQNWTPTQNSGSIASLQSIAYGKRLFIWQQGRRGRGDVFARGNT